MPSIEYNKKIFIERDLVPSITSENIMNEINENMINKKTNDWIFMRSTILYPEIYYENLFKEDINRIPIRILSSTKLNPPPNIKKPGIIQEFLNKLSPGKKSSKEENNGVRSRKISTLVINEYSSFLKKNSEFTITEEITKNKESINKTYSAETEKIKKGKDSELNAFKKNPSFSNSQENIIEIEDKYLEEKNISEFEILQNEEEIIIEDFFQKPSRKNVLEEVKKNSNEKNNEESLSLPNNPKLFSAKGNVLILHIHGGGFIGMSSRSHQSYTRKWAIMLGIPIFSIDYRLAPEFPYPAALDDCWQAYHWLRNNAEEMFGILPKKVIFLFDFFKKETFN